MNEMQKFVTQTTEDVIWRKIGDEIVIITDDGLSIHVLNKTAALIWEMCGGSCSPDTIASSLCERFEVTFEEAIGDVKDIMVKFGELGLLKQTEEATRT
jgi:hypothetical protein